MMNKLFEGVRNIDFVGETVTCLGTLQTAILEDLDTNRWNTLAQKTNTASFIRMIGREPVNYAEVQAWVKSLVTKAEGGEVVEL